MTALETDKVWYFGYGSNLSEQRFHCYILGGKPQYGKASNSGCEDKEPPSKVKAYRIPYELCFGLIENRSETRMWGPGGVAFISPLKDEHRDKLTLGRIYMIKRHQYKDIKRQEGRSSYNREVMLAEYEDTPILTLTHDEQIKNILPPSAGYLKTIAEGLRETYEFSDQEIAEYLFSLNGTDGNFERKDLIEIIRQ